MGVVGCKHAMAVTYCPGFSDSGPVAGQITTISFSGNLTTVGESLNYGQIGSSLSATATDCFGSSVSTAAFTYGTSNMQFADINPTTGQVCGGTWNRNTGGGVADYSVCNPPAASVTGTNAKPLVAYVTASAAGATSNPIPVYIHPVVGNITLGSATTNCTTDPSTNCCPANNTLISTTVYSGLSCVSQNKTAQLVARAFDTAGNNITCQVGHITFTPQSSSSVVTIDANGIATAVQPGSTTILANSSNSGSGSTAGFFSTCPPASISLKNNNSSSPFSVALNNSQTLTTTVLDTNGNPLSGLSLEFVSTSPQTLSAGSNTVTANFPGAATVTAICQPPNCNTSPFSQIGYLGNGKPVTSNGLTVNTTGTSSNQVIVASTNSFFFYSVDFTTGSVGATYKLPYQPNSMVITQDGSTLYLGSTNVLMSVSTSSGSASALGTIPGVVLAVSPDSSTLVIADATRGTTSLYSSTGALQSTYAGVGTRAQFTPDSTTVYIAAGNTMLVHSTYTGWTSTIVPVNYQDVAVTVPAVGAYFAATTETDGRSYCARTTGAAASSPPPATTNVFFPLADANASPTQRIAATNDGAHILGLATDGSVATLQDLATTLPASAGVGAACPVADPTTGTSTPVAFTSVSSPATLTRITASAVNGVIPASNSTLAFVTYTGTSGQLPYYVPATKTVNYVTLTGTATAPVAGAFSSDNKTFYATTSGDNALHILTVNGTTVTDSSTIPLNLAPINGTGTAVPNLIAQHVKRATS